MSYPYSSLDLEAQWAKVTLAQRFRGGADVPTPIPCDKEADLSFLLVRLLRTIAPGVVAARRPCAALHLAQHRCYHTGRGPEKRRSWLIGQTPIAGRLRGKQALQDRL